MIRAKVIGATGYGGVGIVELLLQHPDVEITCLAAKADVGKRLSEVYPHLLGHCDMPIVDADSDESRGAAPASGRAKARGPRKPAPALRNAVLRKSLRWIMVRTLCGR